MSDNTREQLLEAVEFIFMLADKQKQIDCSREYALIKAALSQQPESKTKDFPHGLNAAELQIYCAGFDKGEAYAYGRQQPESEPVDDWLVYCLEYIGAGDPEYIECDAYELSVDTDEGQSGTITVSISEICRKAASALQNPQPSPQVPEGRADEIVTQLYRRFKDWSKRGFGPDDVTWCEVKANVIELLTATPSIAEKPSPAAKEAWVRFQSMLADDDPAKDHFIAEKWEWVAAENPPSRSDADFQEEVVWWDSELGEAVTGDIYSGVDRRYTHWMPTGLQRPKPPEVQQ